MRDVQPRRDDVRGEEVDEYVSHRCRPEKVMIARGCRNDQDGAARQRARSSPNMPCGVRSSKALKGAA